MVNKKVFVGLLATVLASLCCVIPVLAIIAGLGSFASSFSWLQPFHAYLVGFTIIILAWAWWEKLKPSQSEMKCEDSKTSIFLASKKFLAGVTVFSVLMLTFPQWGYGLFGLDAKDCEAGTCATELKEVIATTPACNSDGSCPVAKRAEVTKNLNGTKDEPAVVSYMENEKDHPTLYKNKACTGTGYGEVDDLLAQARKDVQEMSPVVLKKLISNEEDFILLDIRAARQRAEGEIYVDESLTIDRVDLEFQVRNKIKDLNAVIIVYSRMGARSVLAAQSLQKLGYNYVYNLKGGLKAWVVAGYVYENALGVVLKVEEE